MKEQAASSASFRRWKLRLTDLLDNIERLGYDVRCGVAQRVFANMYGSGSDKAWVHHMTETQQELELIIENYEKYGEPPRARQGKTSWFGEGQSPAKATAPPPLIASEIAAAAAIPQPLILPQQMTWDWLKKHMPISWWWYLGAAVVALLVAAFNVGKYADSVDKALHPEHPVVTSSTPSPAPTALPKPASK